MAACFYSHHLNGTQRKLLHQTKNRCRDQLAPKMNTVTRDKGIADTKAVDVERAEQVRGRKTEIAIRPAFEIDEVMQYHGRRRQGSGA